jgi:hypothetical protein
LVASHLVDASGAPLIPSKHHKYRKVSSYSLGLTVCEH